MESPTGISTEVTTENSTGSPVEIWNGISLECFHERIYCFLIFKRTLKKKDSLSHTSLRTHDYILQSFGSFFSPPSHSPSLYHLWPLSWLSGGDNYLTFVIIKTYVPFSSNLLQDSIHTWFSAIFIGRDSKWFLSLL